MPFNITHNTHREKIKKMKLTKQFLFNCDAQTYLDFQNAVGKGNVTKSLEDYMVTTVAAQTGDIEKVEIKIIDKKIQKMQKELTKIQAELQKNLSIREKYDKILEEKETKRLQNQKIQIQNQKVCIHCGNNIPEFAKSHQFPKGVVCNGCFMASSPDDVKRWS